MTINEVIEAFRPMVDAGFFDKSDYHIYQCRLKALAVLEKLEAMPEYDREAIL